MKTTFDLPPDLVKAMKLRAVHEGKKLKDVVTDLLRKGLQPEPEPPSQKAKISIHPISGMPYIQYLNTPGFLPPTSEESLKLIEQANLEDDLRRAGLLS